MFTFVEGAKYRSETISIVVSFADVISTGDSITGVPNIFVSVFSGIDPAPSNIIYLGTSIIGGVSIDQKFRLGVDGCIYCITFQISTLAGDTFEKECYLAILPNTDNAIPNYFPYWLTSNLYPYNWLESLSASILPISGRILEMPHWQENLQVGILPLYGTFSGSAVSYNNPHEDMQNSILPTFGTLVGTFVQYDNPHEDIKHAIAPLYGSLPGTSVSYDNPHEDMQHSILPISGTLV